MQRGQRSEGRGQKTEDTGQTSEVRTPAERTEVRSSPDDLPFVYLNVAMTADGKLAPANRQFVPFGSKRDQDLLLELRTRCDAVMSGARTVDSVPVTLGPGGKRQSLKRLRNGFSEYNLRVVVSGSASLNPDAEIFKHTFSPIIVLVSGKAPKKRIERLKAKGAIVHASGDAEINFTAALKWLHAEWNVKRLLCEGGGEIIGALFKENLVHEVYTTICPLILGGRTAPTLADGIGIEALSQATPLSLTSMRRAGDEMFLVYSVKAGEAMRNG